MAPGDGAAHHQSGDRLRGTSMVLKPLPRLALGTPISVFICKIETRIRSVNPLFALGLQTKEGGHLNFHICKLVPFNLTFKL